MLHVYNALQNVVCFATETLHTQHDGAGRLVMADDLVDACTC